MYVNGVEVGGKGKPAGSRTLLTHNCRIVVGVSHYLRFHNPGTAGAVEEDPKDWAFANEVSARPAHGQRTVVFLLAAAHTLGGWGLGLGLGIGLALGCEPWA